MVQGKHVQTRRVCSLAEKMPVLQRTLAVPSLPRKHGRDGKGTQVGEDLRSLCPGSLAVVQLQALDGWLDRGR